ncbi:MAG: hypothetical protein OXH29_00135 [bacterium]|nr:hypothetical protein [bacterium]
MTDSTPTNGETPSSDDQAEQGISVFQSLNSQFYREHGPGEYILLRLYSLCLVGGSYDTFKDAISKGIDFATLQMKPETVDDPDEETVKSEEALRDHFVRIEAHHLKHLAIETLIRLFMGHKNVPRCPWLEISKETDFRAFKNKVRKQIVEADEGQLQTEVAKVFLGYSGELSSATDEQLDVSQNLVQFLIAFAREWLEEAKSYNATKHGLTAVPGDAVFSIGSKEEEQTTLGYGDSLAHLSHKSWDGDEREWSLTTRWIRLEQAVGTIAIVHQMILPLWSIARARYCGVTKYITSALSSSDFSVEKLREIEGCPMIEASMTVLAEYR